MQIQYLNLIYTSAHRLGYCKDCILNQQWACSKMPTEFCIKYGGFKSSKEKGIFLL